VVQRAGDMQRDQCHQQSRKHVMKDAGRECPEVSRQGTIASEHDGGQVGLHRHDDAAAGHADHKQIEQPVRDPGELVQQGMAGQGRSRVRGSRTHQQPHQHQRQDQNAASHVLSQRIDFHRIAVRDFD